MKQQVLDLIEGLKNAVLALSEDNPSDQIAILQARVADLESQVVQLTADLAAANDKLSQANALAKQIDAAIPD